MHSLGIFIRGKRTTALMEITGHYFILTYYINVIRDTMSNDLQKCYD